MSRGFTVIEAVVSIAIVSVAAIALLSATASATKPAAAPAAVRAALDGYAASVARDASQSWKYGSPGAFPAGTFATSVPAVASASPVAVAVAASVTTLTTQSARIDVSVASGTYTASSSATLYVKAPLPGSRIPRPGYVPAPTATP